MRTSTWFRRSLSAMLAAGALVGLGACSDDGDDAGDDTGDTEPADEGGEDEGDDGGSAAADSITISGFAFESATVGAGATVSISNEDSTAHTVTSDDDLFDVNVSGGSEGELTAPDEAGSYDYHCAIHSSMTGTLVVE